MDIFNKKAVRDLESTRDELSELNDDIKQLLWCIASQREKVECKLHTIINKLYPGHSDRAKYNIRQQILNNIK